MITLEYYITKEKCNTCKEEKEDAVFGQCDECFEKAMEENGSVIYGGEE